MTITMKPDGWKEENKIYFESVEQAAYVAKQLQSGEISKEQLRFMEANPVIKDIMFNPSLSRQQKKLQVLPIVNNLRRKLATEEKEVQKTIKELERLEQEKEALESCETWLNQGQFKLEKNDCSRLHKLIEEFKKKNIVFVNKEEHDLSNTYLLWEGIHSFVVQHDWASAFKNAKDYAEGDIILPYQITAFEFRISGKNIIVIATQMPNELASLGVISFVEINDLWLCHEETSRELAPFILAWEEIRAISIALEAEVAENELIRASHALNKKRVESGKLPLYDYHIVKLSDRVKSNFNAGGTHRSPRLHFRRGHWRNYESHRTWIKWTLVGNPDLGFVDKEYRL